MKKTQYFMSDTILVIGACGQIGGELTSKLRSVYGNNQVIASDIREGSKKLMSAGPFEILDTTDKNQILEVVKKYNVNQVYLLAAMLSAVGEKFPEKTWDLNMTSLLVVLDLAKDKHIQKVFWPSSIAVFGPTTPKVNTPQKTITEPSTVYGISKLSGESWCNYYHKKYGVDVRSIRYPGLISWKTQPSGGTTDYAVDMFFSAVKDEHYTSFIDENTRLPMMYMHDAVDATIQLMQADKDNITIRTSYNLAAVDFTPRELAIIIKKAMPKFTISYSPDYRQDIANSWPQSIDDSFARNDWGWKYQFDLEKLSYDMITNLKVDL